MPGDGRSFLVRLDCAVFSKKVSRNLALLQMMSSVLNPKIVRTLSFLRTWPIMYCHLYVVVGESNTHILESRPKCPISEIVD